MNKASAVESVAHAAYADPDQDLQLACADDWLDDPYELMQDEAELERLRAHRAPRRMRVHF